MSDKLFGWDYPPGVTGNEWQITGEDPPGMMNTTHLFNKARKAALSQQDLEEAIDGLNLDELLAALAEEMKGETLRSDLGKQGWAMLIGIQIGKLLCDPATHLAEH